MLSEVLKERDAQLEYKERKQEALKHQNASYLKFQEEVSLTLLNVYIHLLLYTNRKGSKVFWLI